MKKKKYNSNKINKFKIFIQFINIKNILKNKPIIYIIIIDIRIILECYILTSILLLIFVWLLNTDTIIHIYNNYGLFSIFISLIKRIMGAIIIFYKKNNIFIIWRTPIGINYIVNIINILYISNLFINLLLISKFRANKLYIITKNYII